MIKLFKIYVDIITDNMNAIKARQNYDNTKKKKHKEENERKILKEKENKRIKQEYERHVLKQLELTHKKSSPEAYKQCLSKIDNMSVNYLNTTCELMTVEYINMLRKKNFEVIIKPYYPGGGARQFDRMNAIGVNWSLN